MPPLLCPHWSARGLRGKGGSGRRGLAAAAESRSVTALALYGYVHNLWPEGRWLERGSSTVESLSAYRLVRFWEATAVVKSGGGVPLSETFKQIARRQSELPE